MSKNDRADQGDEPVQQYQGCPMGIPMKALEKMSEEDINDWHICPPAQRSLPAVDQPPVGNAIAVSMQALRKVAGSTAARVVFGIAYAVSMLVAVSVYPRGSYVSVGEIAVLAVVFIVPGFFLQHFLRAGVGGAHGKFAAVFAALHICLAVAVHPAFVWDLKTKSGRHVYVDVEEQQELLQQIHKGGDLSRRAATDRLIGALQSDLESVHRAASSDAAYLLNPTSMILAVWALLSLPLARLWASVDEET